MRCSSSSMARCFRYSISPTDRNRERNTSRCCVCAARSSSLCTPSAWARSVWMGSISTPALCDISSRQCSAVSSLRIVSSNFAQWSSQTLMNCANSIRRCSSLAFSSLRRFSSTKRACSSDATAWKASSRRAHATSSCAAFLSRMSSEALMSSTAFDAVCASTCSTFSRSANTFLRSASQRCFVLSWPTRIFWMSSTYLCAYMSLTFLKTAFSLRRPSSTEILPRMCFSRTSWCSIALSACSSATTISPFSIAASRFERSSSVRNNRCSISCSVDRRRSSHVGCDRMWSAWMRMASGRRDMAAMSRFEFLTSASTASRRFTMPCSAGSYVG
eukprot:PhM_4_TR12001/c0_g1_i1/m.52689